MSRLSKIPIALALLCPILAFTAGCSDDEDETSGGVSAQQAAAFLEQVVPDVIEFSDGLAALIRGATTVARATGGVPTCQPIEIDGTPLCLSGVGESCPGTGGEFQWAFAQCNSALLEVTLDGTIDFSGAAPSFDVVFTDLSILSTSGTQTIDGGIDVLLEITGCNTVSYQGLELFYDGISIVLPSGGTLTICGINNTTGFFTALIDATGVAAFEADVSLFGSTGSALVSQGGVPLYDCSLTIGGAASCTDVEPPG
ncbi:MAG TPA: hypothetical protein VD788_11190 [Candidatus Polarisedimenticolaceae bacterium]|nr:hypothetical protein [Candidatus Polarisedimenticolaceae bacterium]